MCDACDLTGDLAMLRRSGSSQFAANIKIDVTARAAAGTQL